MQNDEADEAKLSWLDRKAVALGQMTVETRHSLKHSRKTFMSKLDDLSWHLGGGEFPDGLPEENGATHIGIFAAWTIANGFWGTFLPPESAAFADLVRSRQLSGRRFLIEHCDGKLLSEMLTPDGAAFAESYYRKCYLQDFQAVLAQGLASDYLVEDSWANYDKLAALITQRHHAWKNKPWWKFWA